MNLFRLDNCPKVAAQQYQDLHVTKIVLEATQLLANCYTPIQLRAAPRTKVGNIRKHSHIHHPISKWTKETRGNFDWALAHAVALADEFKFRFGKPHFCVGFIVWASKNQPTVPSGDSTEQPQCFLKFPECVVLGDPVSGYRNYYNLTKLYFLIRGKTIKATWTKRSVPAWILTA